MRMRDVWADLGRLLFFRLPKERWAGIGSWRHLALGVAFTWLAGIGRYWDSPRGEWWQFAGLGSLAYVVVLSALLWVVLAPLVEEPRQLLRPLFAFVCLTSPPALLYAIPVERFTTLDTATALNMWFLAAVAAWRVALLVYFLRRGLRLDGVRVGVGVLLPVSAILFLLVRLNLEHVIIRIMAGIEPHERSSADDAYGVVFLLSILALPAFAVSLVVWLILCGTRLARRWRGVV